MVRKLLIGLIAALLVMPAAAVAAPDRQAADDYVIVVLKSPPAASYAGGIGDLRATKPERGKLDTSSPAYRAYLQHLANEHANYRAFLDRQAPRAEIVREYHVVLNGFALKLNGTDAAVLARGPDVRAVANSWLYQPTMNVSVDLIDAGPVWTALGGRSDAGAGIKVGIIDSGIDFTHDFFDCKDAAPAKVYASGTAFDPSNVLVFDHGTHVAGTVAGCVMTLPADGPITGTISGVAPGAELFDYNVFPGFGAGFIAFGGSAFSHDIAAALEDSVLDGMDVVNMSLGGSVEGPHDTLAEASNATVDAGVVVVVAAGNSGPGAGTIQSPGSADKVITAGASTNPHFIGISVVVTDGPTFGAALGEFNNFDPPITADYTVTEPALGCSAISTNLTDKIALIDRGECTFSTKVRNAQAAGALGVLVVNNVAGDPTAMAHDGGEFPTIPAAMVGQADGEAMKPAGNVTVDGTDPSEVITDNADIIAGFSSRGPTPFSNSIKPDVTAPGVNVYSSVFENGFEMFSGTSMAAPHTAGAVALLLDHRSELSPADVKSLLANNADRPVWDHVTGTMKTGVMTRGGGRINVKRAMDADVTFDTASLSFGRHSGNRQVNGTIEVTVSNLTAGAITLELSDSKGDPRITLSTDSLVVPGNGSASFMVSLSARGTHAGEGDIKAAGGGITYRLPYWYRTGQVGQ
jgi:minor extracellular serine protease Vpr